MHKKNPREHSPSGIRNKKAAPSYSPTVKTAVPLPQAGLTSEFGMGSGISPPLSAQPKRNLLFLVKNTGEKVYRFSIILVWILQGCFPVGISSTKSD